MPFPYDRYPWISFNELNLVYFIMHFREIFQQWDQLYHDLTDWKEATDQDLADWKTATETGLESWKTGLTASLETWKAQTANDISGWETATLAALDAWKTATTAIFEQIRGEAAGSASAAAASAAAADTAREATELAAARISAELAQILVNRDEIADLKNALNYNKSATPGFVLRATNDGNGQEWAPVGTPTDAQTAQAVAAWLNAHPEATTTIDFRVVSKVFNTVANMKADTTLVSDVTCMTRGYYSAGDDGGAVYQIVSNAPAGFYEELSNGLYAVLLLGDSCNVKQYGAKGDGATDDTTALNNAVLYGAETVYFPEGVYSTEGINCAFKNKTLIGYGATLKSNVINRRVSRYALLSNYPQGRTWQSVVYDDYVNIYGLTFDGNKVIYNTDDPDNEPHYTTGGGIMLTLFKNVVIRDCTVKNTVMSGIWTAACDNVDIENCDFFDISLEIDKTGSLDYIWDAIAVGSNITIDGVDTRVICNNAVIQNCTVFRSLGGAISSAALITTIQNNYIEDNGGYSTEDGFIASTETPVITGYTFVRNIINNVYNRVTLQVYHNNDRFKGNDLIVNFIGNQIMELGGAPARLPGSSASSRKNGLFGCVVTPAQTRARITIKDNAVMSADNSPYTTGNWFDIVGAEMLDISENRMILNAAFYNANNRINAKKLNFCDNDIELTGNNQNVASLFIYASADYDVIMDSLKITDNTIISDYTGSSTGSSVFMCTPSSIKDKIKDCEVSGNVFRGAADRFFGLIGGAIEKLFIKNNVVDANYLIANRTSAEASKGFVKDNVSSVGLLLSPGYPFDVTVGAIANNYPDNSSN